MTANPNLLFVEVVNSPDDAPNYRRDDCDVRTVSIDKCIIVKNGMVNGKATVDFQISAQDGSKFVAMLTGKLVKYLAAMIEGAET
ncbi:MAG: hypothetical protein ABL921_18965 [Pirellula sp.]